MEGNVGFCSSAVSNGTHLTVTPLSALCNVISCRNCMNHANVSECETGIRATSVRTASTFLLFGCCGGSENDVQCCITRHTGGGDSTSDANPTARSKGISGSEVKGAIDEHQWTINTKDHTDERAQE